MFSKIYKFIKIKIIYILYFRTEGVRSEVRTRIAETLRCKPRRPPPTTVAGQTTTQRRPCRRPGSPRRHIPPPLRARFNSAARCADVPASIAFPGSIPSGFWLHWKMRKARGHRAACSKAATHRGKRRTKCPETWICDIGRVRAAWCLRFAGRGCPCAVC